MNRVYDGLYVGGIDMIHKQNYVKKQGITAIVRLDSGNYGNYKWSKTHFNVLHEPFRDADYIPDGIIPKITKFIHQELEDKGEVLVHCAMGVSRSSTMTMAYLIEYKRMSLAEAFGTVREGRSQAQPHPKLLLSLVDYYKLPFNAFDVTSPNFLARLMKDI